MDRLPQFLLTQGIRDFFLEEGFLDVLTPPVVNNPGMEVHIHSFQLLKAKNKEITDLYLHTSPEFHMKELLAEGHNKIFTISYCFRDEPHSPIHRSQFLMLEWYRTNESYEKIMEDCIKLFEFCYKYLEQRNVPVSTQFEKGFKIKKMTIQELFKAYLDIDILEYLDTEDLYLLITNKFKDVPVHGNKEGLEWDDLFFLLFLNKIEPELINHPLLLLYEYPHHLSALSTIKDSDPRVCERFEIYVNGVELANCFNELRDVKLQRKRFEDQNSLKSSLYQYSLPRPDVLFDALEKGLPRSSGIALGVERLLSVLVNQEHVKKYFW